MSYENRLFKAFRKAPVLPLDASTRFCFFSDCHRGDGSTNDNFLKNYNLYFSALKYYYNAGYTYVELGDGDEFWENRNIRHIIEIHNNVFRLLSRFYCRNKLFLLYGNHDMEKKTPGYANHFCAKCHCDLQKEWPLFPDLPFYEGLILQFPNPEQRLYVTHGHQADFWNSTGWKLNRFLVRYLWRPLEHFGVSDPTNAARNYHHKDFIERRLSSFARRLGFPLITGHTHRPRLNSSDELYFNCGSCVHPGGVTCFELVGNCLSLVKWSYETNPDRTLYVNREVLEQVELFRE